MIKKILNFLFKKEKKIMTDTAFAAILGQTLNTIEVHMILSKLYNSRTIVDTEVLYTMSEMKNALKHQMIPGLKRLVIIKNLENAI